MAIAYSQYLTLNINTVKFKITKKKYIKLQKKIKKILIKLQ